MRNPLALLLISLCLAACGQSGDLYRPDEKAQEPSTNAAASEPAAVQGVPEASDEEKEKEKKEAEAAAPASTPAADSTAPSTAAPSSQTP